VRDFGTDQTSYSDHHQSKTLHLSSSLCEAKTMSSNYGPDFCWSCRKDEQEVFLSKGFLYSGICKSCIANFEQTLRENKAETLEELTEQWSGTAYIRYRYISVKKDGKTYFIKGMATEREEHCDTSGVFNLIKQFIANKFRYYTYYGNFEDLTKYDFWFDLSKVGELYHFGGNCHDISNAFNLRTTDIDQVWQYVERWQKIPDRLKQRVIEQLEAGLEFCNCTTPFTREKKLCFKDYNQSQRNNKGEPKIMVLQGLGNQC